MEAAASGKPAEGPAHALLVEQRRLIRWQIFSERASFALKVLTGLVGVAATMLLSAMAWRAAHEEGLVVRGFSAPPAYAARGLTGEVLAGRYIDRFILIRGKTVRGSLMTPQALRAAGEDIRIEIPQTGVSLGEIERLLVRWLGRQTVITGALSEETPGAVTLTVHADGRGAVSVSGPASQLDALVQQLAEKSFAAYQPNQWVVYLTAEERFDEALAAARAIALSLETDDPLRAASYSLWGANEGDPARQIRLFRKAIAFDPKLMAPRRNLALAYLRRGDEQAAFDAAMRTLALKESDQPKRFGGPGIERLRGDARYLRAFLSGDYAGAAQVTGNRYGSVSRAMALGHDGTAARQLVADALEEEKTTSDEAALTGVYAAEAAADWPAMAQGMALYERERDARFNAPPAPGLPPRAASPRLRAAFAAQLAARDAPLLARALARSGDIAQARAVAATTPLDCAPCLRARAEVESAARTWPAADAWYARAAAFAPRLPHAETLWAESLLARGDAAGAIAKLTAAHAKGPRFADPLELWGEAFMRQGQFERATGKFAEAAMLAPRWGRLHLRWGEALEAQGKTEAARAKWRAAAGMDLSAVDRARVGQLLADRV